MIPRPDDGLHRSFNVLKHARNRIAVAVEQASDQEAGNLDFAQPAHRSMPERPVALMLEIHQRPRRGFKAWPENLFVKRVVRGPGHRWREVHVEFELVEMH